MLRAAVLSSLILILILTTACAPLWNLSNRGSLRSDVSDALESGGYKGANLNCQMIGTTRAGYCTFTANNQQIGSLMRKLKLHPVDISNTDDPARLTALKSECMAEFAGGKPTALFIFGSTPPHVPEVKLKSGGRFDTLLIFTDFSTSKSCVEVSYAYG